MEQELQVQPIEEAISVNGIEQGMAVRLRESFTPLFAQAQEWKEKAEGLIVTDASQVEEMKQAREARLALKNIRTDAEKKRKALKESIVRDGKAIDGMVNIIKALIVPIEEHLQIQEDFIKIQEEKALDEQEQHRREALRSIGITDTTFIDLRHMGEDHWAAYYETQKNAYEHQQREAERVRKEQEENARIQKLHNERKAELVDADLWQHREPWLDSECLAEIGEDAWSKLVIDLHNTAKAKAAEAEAQRQENERLKKEADAREKQLAEEKAAREKVEAEQRAAREKAEKEDRERKAAEANAKAEAEAQAKAEAKAKAAEEKAARLAPDKDKLRAFAKDLSTIEAPEVKSAEAQDILIQAMKLIGQAVTTITEGAIKL